MTDISMPFNGQNRHPVDMLAEVRAKIKELEAREKAVAAEVSKLMGNKDSLGGDEFIARQILSSRKGAVDTAKLEKAGIAIDAYRKPDTAVVQIRVEKREMA